MSRLLWLILAVVLVSPTLGAAAHLATSAAFLIEFLSEGRWRPLSAVTSHPRVRRLEARAPSPAVATYTISAVPDPVAVLREMRRVVKPGGNIVLLNHFRSQRRVVGRLEDLVAPVCTRLGWKSNLLLEPLLQQVGLTPEIAAKVNLFNGWRLIKCVNRK